MQNRIPLASLGRYLTRPPTRASEVAPKINIFQRKTTNFQYKTILIWWKMYEKSWFIYQNRTESAGWKGPCMTLLATLIATVAPVWPSQSGATEQPGSAVSWLFLTSRLSFFSAGLLIEMQQSIGFKNKFIVNTTKSMIFVRVCEWNRNAACGAATDAGAHAGWRAVGNTDVAALLHAHCDAISAVEIPNRTGQSVIVPERQ